MAELKAIHDFSAAPSVGASTLLLVDSVDAQASSGYRTDSMSAGALGAAVAGTFAYNSLNTTDKTIIGAINELEAGGGGAGGMYVTVMDNVTYYSIDKTFAEISAAIQAGTNIIVAWEYSSDYYIYLQPIVYDESSGEIKFQQIEWEETIDFKGYVYFASLFDDESFTISRVQRNILQYTDYTGTLTAGQTSLTISGAGISSTKTMDFYTDIYGVSPTAVSVSSGSVTLTFEAQSANMSVKVRVW